MSDASAELCRPKGSSSGARYRSEYGASSAAEENINQFGALHALKSEQGSTQLTNATSPIFEMCCRKRNVIDYTRAQVATDTETEEIVEKATEFYEFVEAWIDSKFAI